MMNASELKAGTKAFQDHEARDAMYKTATFLVKHFWGNPREMADSLGVLLLTWNQAFYRYGLLDFSALENCIARNQQALDSFRNQNILSYAPADDDSINNLYEQFLKALQIADGKAAGRQSPVAVAKALHLLAPAFYPLWDDKIAKAYGCHYKYIPYMQKMRNLVNLLTPEVDVQSTGKTLLKLIDEYNYAKFTKAWV
ncbi:MAG TPA: hypothetical protein VGK87_09025 [Anaerolineae bacterium]|jgi:hypothetical protein